MKYLNLLLALLLTVSSLKAQNYFTLGTVSWNVPSVNWSLNGSTGCSCSPSGVSGANITIRTGHTVLVLSAGDINTNNNIDIQGGGILELRAKPTNPINVLDGTTGNGRLKLEGTSQLPTVVTNNFVNNTTNIIEISNVTTGFLEFDSNSGFLSSLPINLPSILVSGATNVGVGGAAPTGVNFVKGTFTVNVGTSITYNFMSLNLEGNGAINGTLAVGNGRSITIASSSNTTIQPSGTLSIGTNGASIQGTLTNNGTMVTNNFVTVAVGSGGVLNNNSTFTVNDDTFRVDAGGVMNNDGTLNINNTNGRLIVEGLFNQLASGTIAFGGGAMGIFNAGGTYHHQRSGGSIPQAAWAATSNCIISQNGTGTPTGWNGQIMGNVEWNSPSQASNSAFFSSGSGNILTIQGNFIMTDTGASGFAIYNGATAGDALVNIGGSLIQTGGGLTLSSNNGNTATHIAGNLQKTSGSFSLIASTNPTLAELFIEGNVDISTGSLGINANTGTNPTTRLIFTGTNNQSVQGLSLSSGAVVPQTLEIITNKPSGTVTFLSAPIIPTNITTLFKIDSGTFNLSNFSCAIGSVQGVGGILQIGTSTLSITDNGSNFTGTLNSLGLIQYNGSVAQSIFSPSAGNYRNLTLSGTGVKTLAGNISIAGDFMNNVGVSNFAAGINTITFMGATTQTITGTSEFHHLNINNNVLLAASSDTRVRGTIAIANDKYLTLSNSNFTSLMPGALSAGVNKYIVTNGTGAFKFRNESGSTMNGFYITAPLGYSSPNKYAGFDMAFDGLANNEEISIRVLQPGFAPAPSIAAPDRVEAVWEVILPTGASPNTSLNSTLFYTGSVVGTISNGGTYFYDGLDWVAETTTSSGMASTIFTPSNFSGMRYFSVFSAIPPSVITITPSALADGTVDTFYNENLSASGGTAPYSFSLLNGTLPDGVTLDITGLLSGTPLNAGTFNFTVFAIDGSLTGTQDYVWIISKAPQQVDIGTFTTVPLDEDSYELFVVTSSGLPAKYRSTNPQVASLSGSFLTIHVNRINGEAEILAFQDGDNNYNASDTVIVMKVNNFGITTSFQKDLESLTKIYPNPATEKILIETLSQGLEVKEACLMNNKGEILNTQMIQNNQEQIYISLETLSGGIYFLKITTNQGIFVKKITKY